MRVVLRKKLDQNEIHVYIDVIAYTGIYTCAVIILDIKQKVL